MEHWFQEQKERGLPFSGDYMKQRRRRVLITIGMITWGRPALLAEALSALMPQLSTETELLVVVDGPDRETLALLHAYNHPQLRIVEHTENQGRPTARNRLIAEAYGDYILWVDDDDIPGPELVSRYLSLLRSGRPFDVAYCDIEVVYLNSGKLRQWSEAPDVSGTGAALLQQLIGGKGIVFTGSLIRRALYFRIGGFDTRFDRAQDYDFWFRAALHARFIKLKERLYTYRINTNGATFGHERDYTYESLAIRSCLQRTPLETIFPGLNWNDPEAALRWALLFIAQSLSRLGDHYYAWRFLNYVPVMEVSSEVTEARVRSSIALGRPGRARLAMAGGRHSVQGMSRQLVMQLSGRINYFEECIASLEEAMQSRTRARIATELKRIRTEFGLPPQLHETFAQRFEEVGDLFRAARFRRAVLRLQPEDSATLEWLQHHAADARESRAIARLYERIVGVQPDMPLYRLKMLELPGDPVVSSFASAAPRPPVIGVPSDKTAQSAPSLDPVTRPVSKAVAQKPIEPLTEDDEWDDETADELILPRR